MGKQKAYMEQIERIRGMNAAWRALRLRWIPGPAECRRGSALEFHDILGLQTLGAFDQFEFHHLPLIEGAVAIALDGTEVDENIVFTFLSGDEAKTLGVVEPLYRAAYTICHATFLGLSFCFYYALPADAGGRDWKSLLPR
jgi:hypothetical protein